ncbi:MAG: hypothetical protein ACKV2T_38430 [Kofleriaceae bacterium]
MFAAGILLWELLAGRRLFLGETDYQTVELVREARVPVVEDLDPALETILRRALARDVGARFQSATDFGDALAQYASSREIKLAPAEIGKMVGDVKFEINYERSAKPIDRERLTHVQAQVAEMISIGDDIDGLDNSN